MNFTLKTIKLLSLSRSIPKETLLNCKKGIWIAFLSREIDKNGTEIGNGDPRDRKKLPIFNL
jgi:hypothetical protein